MMDTNGHYASLREAFRAILSDACARLADTPVPTREWTTVEDDGRVTTFTTTYRPDFEGHVPASAVGDEALDTLLAAFAPHQDLLASILRYRSINVISSLAEQRNLSRAYLIRPVLAAYTQRVQGYRYDADAVETILDRLVIDLTSPTIVVRHISPLIRLRLEEDVLPLDSDIQLLKTNTSQFETWLNNYEVGPLLFAERTTPDNLPCLLEVQFQRDRTEQWARQSPSAQLGAWRERDYVTLALRLLTNVYIGEFFTVEETDSLLWATPGNWSPREIRGRGQPNYPTLGPGDTTKIVELLGQLKALLPQPSLLSAEGRFGLAIARWDSGLARKRGVDQLVDHWIALESLFASDATTEIAYRVSLRIAAQIGRTPNERERLYQEMRKAYGWRSKTVHGDRAMKPKHQQELAEAITNSSACLRSALIGALRDGVVFNDKTIEIALLRSSALEADPQQEEGE